MPGIMICASSTKWKAMGIVDSRKILDGFIGVLVGGGTTTPFEHAREVRMNLEIPFRRGVAICIQRCEQRFESFPVERPFPPRRADPLSSSH